MKQHIVGFFCGMGFTTTSDSSYQNIRESLVQEDFLLGYDGCQVKGGGFFAYGVEEQAEAFLADFKRKCDPEALQYQLNLVAHSRGVFSALIVIKKLQMDPAYKDKISITADLHDPVPGNFQVTTSVASQWTIGGQLRDLRDCSILKKVYITLQEKPIFPLAFDTLIPQVARDAKLEIEALPGYHDGQHRRVFVPGDLPGLHDLGDYKSLAILEEDGHELLYNQENKAAQLQAYDRLLSLVNDESISLDFEDRDIHFGGRIRANRVRPIEAINWRHAALKNSFPSHVLYGTFHPDYYLKTPLEDYCDLTLALDTWGDEVLKQPMQMEPLYSDGLRNSVLVELAEADRTLGKVFQKLSLRFITGTISAEEYEYSILTLWLDHDMPYEKKEFLYELRDRLLASYRFQSLDNKIASLAEGSPLQENLLSLKKVLVQAYHRQGAFYENTINRDNIRKMIKNTVDFLNELDAEKPGSEAYVLKVRQFLKENNRLAKNIDVPAHQRDLIVYGGLALGGILLTAALLTTLIFLNIALEVGVMMWIAYALLMLSIPLLGDSEFMDTLHYSNTLFEPAAVETEFTGLEVGWVVPTQPTVLPSSFPSP